MYIKKFGDWNTVSESSITGYVWQAYAQDFMKTLIGDDIKSNRVKCKVFFTGDKIVESNAKYFDSIYDAIDFLLDEVRSAEKKYKSSILDDYCVYDISKLGEDYGFKEVKLGMKVNNNSYGRRLPGLLSLLVSDKKYTSGIMKYLNSGSFFEAGKIIIE